MKDIKQQFQDAIINWQQNKKVKMSIASKCESISDTMAIEFAKWVYKELMALPKYGLMANTHEELLSIFKTEYYKK